MLKKPLLIRVLLIALIGLTAAILVIDSDILYLSRKEEITNPAPEPEPVAPPEEPAPTISLAVYFGNTELNPEMEDCSLVFPVEREVPRTQGVARAVLSELFTGPTEEEKEQGYVSFFSQETADILKNVHIENDTAYVDLEDIRSIIPNASSSCGSAQLMAEIETTLKQFITVERVILAIDSDPETFYEWIQVGCTEENDFCDDAPFTVQKNEEQEEQGSEQGTDQEMEQ